MAERVVTGTRALHLLPKLDPREFRDRRDLQESSDRAAMERRDGRVADQLLVVVQHRRQLVPAPVETDAEKADIRDRIDDPRECRVAPLLDDAYRFRLSAVHASPRISNVKAPVAVAVGSSIELVQASARTKATVRVTR